MLPLRSFRFVYVAAYRVNIRLYQVQRHFFSNTEHPGDYKMIGQKKISSFFSPKSAQKSEKRPFAETQQSEVKSTQVTSAIDQEVKATPPKKVKPNEPTSPLSPEQKTMIEKKRQEALGKLKTKQIANAPDHMGESWKVALAAEFSKPYFMKLHSFVDTERQRYTIYPPPKQVFTWTQCCNITDVKVVILGQDPYHGPRQAHGLCFSVQEGVPPPPSLVNMYKELCSNIDGFQRPKHGYLQGWAKQGVLLLNAVLTVRAGQANSHKEKGWEKFTDAVISWLNKNLDDVVFLLWGSYAHKKGAIIDKKKHHILKSVHPSPLSAHRGFLGCHHFSKANELLEKQGKEPIDWKNLPLGE